MVFQWIVIYSILFCFQMFEGLHPFKKWMKSFFFIVPVLLKLQLQICTFYSRSIITWSGTNLQVFKQFGTFAACDSRSQRYFFFQNQLVLIMEDKAELGKNEDNNQPKVEEKKEPVSEVFCFINQDSCFLFTFNINILFVVLTWYIEF